MDLIKKPRGRPRKNPEEIKKDEEIKPRGRPRKNPEEIKKDEEIKPRGRPHKNPEEIKKDEEIKPKGRPHKNPEEIKKEEEIKPKGRPHKNPEEIKKEVIRDKSRINNYEDIKRLLGVIGELEIIDKEIYLGNIKIIKRIGSNSKNGIILLGLIGDYKIALKIGRFNSKNINELKTLKNVTDIVLANKTNHFPMLYNYKTFEPMEEYERFPKIFHKFLKKPYIIYINELAEGDLKSFLNENYMNDELILNALIQSIMSLIDFYKNTGKFHNDSHSGNFLFHKIPSTKDFQYEYDGKIIKLKNLGYLFVIWDLEKSIEFHKIKYENKFCNDIQKLLLDFMNKDDKNFKGYMDVSRPYGKQVKLFVADLYKSLITSNIKTLDELISFLFIKFI
jgi:hypothetical protein